MYINSINLKFKNNKKKKIQQQFELETAFQIYVCSIIQKVELRMEMKITEMSIKKK